MLSLNQRYPESSGEDIWPDSSCTYVQNPPAGQFGDVLWAYFGMNEVNNNPKQINVKIVNVIKVKIMLFFEMNDFTKERENPNIRFIPSPAMIAIGMAKSIHTLKGESFNVNGAALTA